MNMKHMLLLLLYAGEAIGQFLFDSPEDISREFFGSVRNRNNRFRFSIEDDSDEKFFRNRGNPSPFLNSRAHNLFRSTGRFGNGNTGFRNQNFGFGNGNRNVGFKNNRFIDSDEIFINGNRIDLDSRENFFGVNPNSFRSKTNKPSNFRSQNRPSNFGSFRSFSNVPRSFSTSNQFFGLDSDEILARSFGFNLRRPPTRSSNSFNRIRGDSIEDIFEDLFDDDFDDRIRAQNALSRLRNNGRNSFSSNHGKKTNFVSFQKPKSTLGAAAALQQQNRKQRQQELAFKHFSIQPHLNKIPQAPFTSFSNGFSFNTKLGNPSNSNFRKTNNQNNKNAKLKSTHNFNNQRNRNQFNPSRKFNNFSNKRSSKSLNNIPRVSKNKKSASRQGFSSPINFNWPGGNGYYVSMSTGNGKPVTYFVRI